MRRSLSLAAALLIFFVAPAAATTIEHTWDHGSGLTNWDTIASIPRYNGSGTLLSVYLELSGTVSGEIKFENTGPSGAPIRSELSATLVLNRPDGSQLVAIFPETERNASVTGFDNLLDYGGTSGRTFSDLSSSAFDSALLTSFSDRMLFVGGGSIDLPINAYANSYASGSGNLDVKITTLADAHFIVRYEYIDTPEPGTFVLIGIGLFAFARLRRRHA